MKLIIITALLLLPLQTNASELTQADCQKIGMAGASAMNNMSKGVPKDRLKAVLPPLESIEDLTDLKDQQMAAELHQSLDEVYAFDPINVTAFMVYKSESCIHRIAGGKVVPYAEAHAELKACSSGSDDDVIECSINAAGATGD
ncbi:MAG: hypothetical protein ACI9LO_002951 [Planctomycetota bacterium]|jgi:hypothetical protein